MKKKISQRCIFALSIALASLLFAPSSSAGQALSAIEAQRQTFSQPQDRPSPSGYQVLVKTYFLKHVNPSDIIPIIKFYVIDLSSVNNALTIKILNTDLPAFEELLKKLDVEKKNILFRLFIVHALKESASVDFQKDFERTTKEVENADLKKVLDELKNLWNFKFFRSEISFLLATRDGSGANSCRFGYYDTEIQYPRIIGDEPGKRIIAIGQIKLTRLANIVTETPINTSDVRLKENGYLVVGVSGLPGKGAEQALILVLSAEIK